MAKEERAQYEQMYAHSFFVESICRKMSSDKLNPYVQEELDFTSTSPN